MYKLETDSDIEGWFSLRQLPWNKCIAKQLDGFGMQCIEDLNLVPRDKFLNLFSNGGEVKFVIAAKAKLAHEQLCE